MRPWRGFPGGEQGLARLTREVTAALRRRPPTEERLAGALRAVAPRSVEGRELLADAARTLARRQAFSRPLFFGALGGLVDAHDPRGHELLALGLAVEDVELRLLGLAAFDDHPSLGASLLRAAGHRSPAVAFAAEVVRLLRGESSGSGLEALALRLKEASRIELSNELFWPLLRSGRGHPGLGPALAVMRGAERHLGRWLLLAELGVRSGDEAPRAQASLQARQGPRSARGAWSLIEWALDASPREPPGLRAPMDALIRLSDRPSTERDLSFLFRLAGARAMQVKTHLDGLVERLAQAEETAVRAAFFLVRDHGREDLKAELRGVLRSRKEGAWGLSAAVLHDLGDASAAEVARSCLGARSLSALSWGVLVLESLRDGLSSPLLSEARFRLLHLGALA